MCAACLWPKDKTEIKMKNNNNKNLRLSFCLFLYTHSHTHTMYLFTLSARVAIRSCRSSLYFLGFSFLFFHFLYACVSISLETDVFCFIEIGFDRFLAKIIRHRLNHLSVPQFKRGNTWSTVKNKCTCEGWLRSVAKGFSKRTNIQIVINWITIDSLIIILKFPVKMLCIISNKRKKRNKD